jgi:hypothetical protein
VRLIACGAFLLIVACSAPPREQADTSAAGMSVTGDSASAKRDSTPNAPGSRPQIEREQRDSTGRILGRDRAKAIDINDPKRQLPTVQDTAKKVP